MRIIKTKDYNDLSLKAAEIISGQVMLKNNSVLGLATGSTPIGTYKELIKKYEKGLIDFSEIITVNLDEYRGLAPDNDQSYRYFMNKNLFDHINIDKSNTYVPNGLEANAEKACMEYDALIAGVGGIDLQLLGLGVNGHIGFNEPADSFPLNTNCVKLTQSTIDANKRFFEKEEDVPKEAYTVGIGAIMQANTVLLLASGKSKAPIVKEAFFGEIKPQVPASILQMHKNFILIADEDALSQSPLA
ncbi:MAG: glucosamine-6-phosphate deaminase [Eubacteriales bacterium]|nr:glucosamine-6-phosphate deaminase [Eubacteriales bacterium]